MYSIINNNPAFITNKEIITHFTDYSFLINLSNFNSKDYKQKYKKFWAMNAARGLAKNEIFYNEYFNFIEQNIGNDKADISELLTKIENTDAGFQFSFVSKAIHVINSNQPIFDANVGKFYFLKKIESDIKWNDKVDIARKYYIFLQKEYQRIVEDELLKPTIDRLDACLIENNINPKSISIIKKIDSIIWAWVNHLNKGAIINEKIIWQ